MLFTALVASALLTADPVEPLFPQLDALYCDLHQNPELSHQEVKTSAKLADSLKKLGYDVTTGVGGTGIVAVMKNGPGATVLLRTDLDALPVEEKTGLPYASKVQAKDDQGATVNVMHACGHDLHMTMWLGAATVLAQDKKSWRGTLVLVGQPAEERGEGARGMIKDGLLTRFPRPDYAIALHDHADLASTQVGVVSGFICANVDSVDVNIYGRGGHGAYPQLTVDPIVIGARVVSALQTIVARENSPFDPAVVTVGSFHAGTKHNIIPEEAKLQLTVRSYKPEVRKKLLAAIERIVKAEAEAAGAPKPPEVKVIESNSATYNDPKLAERLRAAMVKDMGESAVTDGEQVMGAEDFSELHLAGVPSFMLWIGATEPSKLKQIHASGTPVISTHSPQFAPDKDHAIRTGIHAYLAMVHELLPVK
ncbi:MAG: amidohydrolase [Myxococcaceae bacterium]